MQINGVEFDQAKIARLCHAAGVTRLFAFGSILTDRFGRESEFGIDEGFGVLHALEEGGGAAGADAVDEFERGGGGGEDAVGRAEGGEEAGDENGAEAGGGGRSEER